MKPAHDGLGTISMEQSAVNRESSFTAVIMDQDASSGDKDRLLTVIRCRPSVSGFLFVLMGTFPKVPTAPAYRVSLILGTGLLLWMLVAGVSH